jgi:hypothetical protein
MDKLFPDMSGYRIHMVKVQQQEGVNDCGLFACAYITLLASGLDPSQYNFDQGSLRFAFRNLLLENKVQFFDGTYTSRPVEITTISVDWDYKLADKFANLIEQYKEKRSKEYTNESYITL